MSEVSTDRDDAYARLVNRLDIFEPDSKFGKILVKISRSILESFSPAVTDSAEEIIEIAREQLPPPKTFFNAEFYQSPLIPVANLRRILDFFNAGPGTSAFYDHLNLKQEGRSLKRVMNIVFMCYLFHLSAQDSYEVLKNYGNGCSLTQSLGEQPDQNSIGSEQSGNTAVSRRLDAQEAQLNEIIGSLRHLSTNDHRRNSGKSEAEIQASGYQDVHATDRQVRDTQVGLNNNRAHQADPNIPSFARPAARSYSSVGYIPTLSRPRPARDSSGSYAAVSLMKVYARPHVQFAGTGDLSENLATYHQAFMSNCKSLGMSESDALANMHVLFRANSEASIFYHRQVLYQAKTLEEAFQTLYNRFSSSERRDRLLYKWNNLSFKHFHDKPGATRQSALRDLCETASMIQLQLGPSYQDDQHLRDTLMNACKMEPWAHRLTSMPTKDITSVQESLAKAISAEETHEIVMKNQKGSAALVNLADMPGLPYRRYGQSNFKRRDFGKWKNDKASNGKNPIRNNARLLCRNCKSDEHLLRDSDKLSTAKRISFAATVLCTESVQANCF